MSESRAIVVIGGGHGGARLCSALAAAGLALDVQLVCAEPQLPYHRPPLSKAFLKGLDEPLQWHRPEGWYAKAGIQVRCADPAVSIDRSARTVRLRSGVDLPYRWLVLATGAQVRHLPHLPRELSNVARVRSAADALRLRSLLHGCQRLTVIGGGFIGLEIAASALALGKSVQVLESAQRLLARAVSPEISQHVLTVHRERGVDVRIGVAVGGFDVAGDMLRSIEVEGVAQPVELVVEGIGAVPEHALATEAGLHCDNGIVVDEYMRTSDPAVLAIGDCASFVEASRGRRVRLESVQNANDQARTAAATIGGELSPYRAVPWFWSDQGELRLQMAGLVPPDGTRRRRNGPTSRSFSMLHYVDDRLVCVESVNAPADHIAARKLLDTGRSVPPDLACDPAVALKDR